MTAAMLVIVCAVGQAPERGKVTAAEKKEFFSLLSRLPTRGEFFTEEGVAKAVPYTRVLLSLTETDLKDRDIYPFLALSAGLVSHKESRESVLKHFDQIAHPVLKLSWASMLARDEGIPRHIIGFVKKALDSPDDARILSAMHGPGFEAFKREVNEAFEKGRANVVELVKTHKTEALPPFALGFAYRSTSLVLSPNGSFHAVRCLDSHGELIAHSLETGARKVRPIPQPPGLKAEEGRQLFSQPLLARNSAGDLLCGWMILGNGDHGLGLLKAGANAFLVKRIERSLYHMVIVDDQEGGWLLVVGGPQFTVYRVEADLRLTALGSFAGQGSHRFDVLDARMIAPGVLHCFWGDVVQQNHLRMRCVDFDLQRKIWLHDRVIQRIDEFVSSANRPKIVQLADKTLHYLWRVDTGQVKTRSAGTYYHSESHGATMKLTDGYEFSAVACGNRLVVCSTDDRSPNKAFFRVIHNGAAHAPTAVTIANKRDHGLWIEDMAVATHGDRIWFMNTQATDVIHELRLADEKRQP